MEDFRIATQDFLEDAWQWIKDFWYLSEVIQFFVSIFYILYEFFHWIIGLSALVGVAILAITGSS